MSTTNATNAIRNKDFAGNSNRQNVTLANIFGQKVYENTAKYDKSPSQKIKSIFLPINWMKKIHFRRKP